MRFHWQNLNEDRDGRRKGSGLRHGRCWFRLSERVKLGLEWVFLKLDLSVALHASPNDSAPIGGHVCLPGVALYFNLESRLAKRLAEAVAFKERRVAAWDGNRSYTSYDGVRSSLAIHDWTIWIKPWSRDMEWRSKDRWWIRGLTFDIPRFFLGATRCTWRTVEQNDVLIPMPEGTYPATVQIQEGTWKRPRWFAKRRIGAKVDIPEGIGFPGKGENSWDCGEDGLYGLSCGAKTVPEAIGHVVSSVLETRRRRCGGRWWEPRRVRETA